jgi:hypothetical protein
MELIIFQKKINDIYRAEAIIGIQDKIVVHVYLNAKEGNFPIKTTMIPLSMASGINITVNSLIGDFEAENRCEESLLNAGFVKS